MGCGIPRVRVRRSLDRGPRHDILDDTARPCRSHARRPRAASSGVRPSPGDPSMTNALIYHIASGQAFFSGVALVHLAAVLATRASGRRRAALRTASLRLGLLLIAVSGTPLPVAFYAPAGLVSIAWGVAGRPS